MISFPIYLDNHSTTRVDDEVIEAMLPYFNKIYGNPSSTQHKFGWEAEAVVESSRNKIAEILKCEPDEIIFTSGATESNNLAILGIALAYSSRGKHIITTAIEHPSVLEPVKFLAKNGFETTIINPEPNGIVSIDKIFSKIRNDTILVTVMTANNEIGTLQPVKEIAEHCVKENIFFHTDAAQAFGKIQLNLSDLKADLVSLSGHKTHGPKGVGILFMRKKNPRIRLHKILYGGGQEKGLRSGTLNVPLIVGIRKCFEIVCRDFEKNYSFIKSLRDHLLNGFLTFIDGTHVNGSMELRLITKEEAENLLNEIKGYKNFIDEKAITVEHHSHMTINGVHFQETSIKLPTFFMIETSDETQIEVSIQKQQYASGVQPMVYFCIPLRSFKNSSAIYGRSSVARDRLVYIINKTNVANLVFMMKVFGMASKRHNHDVVEILKILLEIISR